MLITCLCACSDLATDPLQEELARYTVLFTRNDTELNVSGGTGRSIFTVWGDGTNLRNLSQHPAGGYGALRGFDDAPRFSPDGKSLAFLTNRAGGQEIFVMNADGTNKRNITNDPDLDLEFDWSPDGQRIAFTRLVGSTYRVMIVDVDGSNAVQESDSTLNARYPVWSPNGGMLAYSRLMSGTNPPAWQIVTRDLNSGTVQIISDSSASAVFPHWSTDSKRVYYMVLGVGLEARSLDGSFEGSLPGCFPYKLSWSPGGDSFLCDDGPSIAVVDRDLSSFRPLYVDGFDPEWSQDGRWILFLHKNTQLVDEVFAVTSNGSAARRVSSSPFGEGSPSWKP